jgi:hypothetical protein
MTLKRSPFDKEVIRESVKLRIQNKSAANTANLVSKKTIHLSNNVKTTLIFFLLWVFTITWWSKFKNYKFVQDDLILFPYFQNEKLSVWYKIFGGSEIANRWRPVTNFFTWFFTELLGTNHLLWFLINVSLITITGFILAKVTLRKSNQILLSVLIALAYVTSRFQIGLVTQAAFLVENISSLLFVILFGLIVTKLEFSKIDLINIFCLFILLILTHERFATLGLPIVVGIYFKAKRIRLRNIGILITFGTVMIYFLFKKYFLMIPLFVGTGSAWNVGFSIKTFFIFTKELIVGILGINIGTPSLNGYVLSNQNPLAVGFSIAILLYSLKQIFTPATNGMFNGITKSKILQSLFPITLFLALSIPIVSTIRLEQRWFLTPYIAFLYFLVPKSSPKLKPIKLQNMYVILILSLLMNTFYLKHTDDIYFNQDAITAGKNAELYLMSETEKLDSNSKIAIISSEDTEGFNRWYENFFSINFPGVNFAPTYYSSLTDAVNNSRNSSVLVLKNGILSNLKKEFGDRGYILTGQYWSDDWAGKSMTVSSSNSTCRIIKVNFLGSPFINSVRITNRAGELRKVSGLMDAKTLDLETKSSLETFLFVFENVYVPASLGINGDVRNLSTRLQVSCTN